LQKIGEPCGGSAAVRNEMNAVNHLAPIAIHPVHPTVDLCRTWSFDVHKSPQNGFTGQLTISTRRAGVGRICPTFQHKMDVFSAPFHKTPAIENKPSNSTFFSRNPQTGFFHPKHLAT
jgi:hypothetical protein